MQTHSKIGENHDRSNGHRHVLQIRIVVANDACYSLAAVARIQYDIMKSVTSLVDSLFHDSEVLSQRFRLIPAHVLVAVGA